MRQWTKENRRKIRKGVRFIRCVLPMALFLLLPWTGMPLQAAEAGSDTRSEEPSEEELEESAREAETSLLDTLEFQEVNEALKELFPEKGMDFQEAVLGVLEGDLSLSAGFFKDLFINQLTYAFRINKVTLVQMILIALVAAVFTNFTDVFQNKQTSEISFYVLYMLMIALCLNGFQAAADWTEEGVLHLTDFMKALGPVYFAAVAVAKGSISAAAFYNLILFLILLVEMLMLNFLLPLIHIYMMLKVLNFLSQEEYLSRFTELIETVVNWSLKTLLACVIGLNVIQGLITPAIDSVKRSVLTRGAEAIPGIGDVIGGTAEVVLGTAIVVKNSIGIVGAIVCIAICLVPLVQSAMMVLLYKLAAAFVQPVSDKRLTGCIGSMAEGCQLLLRVIFTAGVLFLLTIAIVAATTSGT